MTATKFCVLISIANAILFLSVFAGVRIAPESAPAARGAAYAETMGCIGCHGDPENPKVDRHAETCSNTNKSSLHPEYAVECGDVFAYFETVRLQRNFAERIRVNVNNPLIAGENLAREYHCFQCHGQLGQGGFSNAKSFKGYVPGYFGSDFEVLTSNADPDSVREWIMHGIDTAIVDEAVTGRIAGFFFDRQAVKMPSFKSLEPQEIENLVYYVTTLHEYGPMTASEVRSYGERSQTFE